MDADAQNIIYDSIKNKIIPEINFLREGAEIISECLSHYNVKTPNNLIEMGLKVDDIARFGGSILNYLLFAKNKITPDDMDELNNLMTHFASLLTDEHKNSDFKFCHVSIVETYYTYEDLLNVDFTGILSSYFIKKELHAIADDILSKEVNETDFIKKSAPKM